jgi:hypothetical protein
MPVYEEPTPIHPEWQPFSNTTFMQTGEKQRVEGANIAQSVMKKELKDHLVYM